MQRTSLPVSSVAFLVRIDPDGPRLRFRLFGNEIVVGRGTSCAIRVDDASLSRHHARISLGRAGWIVEDLCSTNGTYLDHVPVISHAVMRPGDVLELGNVRFTLVVAARQT